MGDVTCHWHIKVVKGVDIFKLMGNVAKDLVIRKQEGRAPQKLTNGYESAAF